MTDRRRAEQEDTTGVVLARLGRDVLEPLDELTATIHALQETSSARAEPAVARVVALAHRLRTILEPVTALARLETNPASGHESELELRRLFEETIEAHLSASFELVIRGELGTSIVDKRRLGGDLSLMLGVVARMVESKAELRVHREVHSAADRVVMTIQLQRDEPVALAVLNRLAPASGVDVELDANTLRLGFPVSNVPVSDSGPSATPARPVLAFRREDPDIPPVQQPTEPTASVLVVDPEPTAQDYLCRILELEGFDVVRCSTLRDAYDKAHARRPDVITIDRLQLALEGDDWLRRFKEDPALARVPLVLVQSEESEAFGLVGIADVVRKPIDPDEVVDTVERLTGPVSRPVLLVRDERNADTWQTIFGERPTLNVVASTVTDAERVLDTLSPAALVVEVRDSEAVAFLERLRRNPRTESVPLIAVCDSLSSADRSSVDTLATRQVGFGDLDRQTLHRVLDEVIAGVDRPGFGQSNA